MVVDNDPDVSGLLRDFLEASGFSTYVAKDGLAALALLAQLESRQRGVDLIVLDLRMPELDGKAFLKRLEETCEAHPPVIVISGFITQGDRAYFASNELVCGILEKPFDLLDLERMAREQLKLQPDESPGLWTGC